MQFLRNYFIKYIYKPIDFYGAIKFSCNAVKYCGIFPLTIYYDQNTKTRKLGFSKICEFFILCITTLHLISFILYLHPRTQEKVLEVDGHLGSFGNYYLLITGTIFMIFSPIHGFKSATVLNKICDDIERIDKKFTKTENEIFYWILNKNCVLFVIFVLAHCIPMTIIICVSDIDAYGHVKWLIISMIYDYPHIRIMTSGCIIYALFRMILLKLRTVNDRLENFCISYSNNPFSKKISQACHHNERFANMRYFDDIYFSPETQRHLNTIFWLYEILFKNMEVLNALYGSYFAVSLPVSMGIIIFYALFISISVIGPTKYYYEESVAIFVTWWIIFSVVLLYCLIHTVETCYFEVGYILNQQIV